MLIIHMRVDLVNKNYNHPERVYDQFKIPQKRI